MFDEAQHGFGYARILGDDIVREFSADAFFLQEPNNLFAYRFAMSDSGHVRKRYRNVGLTPTLLPSSIRTQSEVRAGHASFILDGRANVTMNKTIKLLLAGFIAFHLVSSARSQFASDVLSGRMKARDGVTAFYTGAELTPSMIVRADNIFTDYERKGFFRIGVLPLGVMEGVVFEVCRPELVTNSLVQLHDWIGSQAAKRFEFRKVSFLTLAGSTNRLESGRARIVSDGKWELLDGVRFRSGTNQFEAPRATLQVAGEKTGQVIMATTPPLTNNLFARSEFPTIHQKETP